MKTENKCMYRATLVAGLLLMLPCALSACGDDEIQRPEVTAPLMPDLGPEATEGTISLSQIETSTPLYGGYGRQFLSYSFDRDGRRRFAAGLL